MLGVWVIMFLLPPPPPPPTDHSRLLTFFTVMCLGRGVGGVGWVDGERLGEGGEG